MRIPQPGISEVVPPRTVQRILYGKGGEVDDMYTRCIEVWEHEVYEVWSFNKDGICEVHLYDQVQTRKDFFRETFHTHFLNARRFQITFLGRISVNSSFAKWSRDINPLESSVDGYAAQESNLES